MKKATSFKTGIILLLGIYAATLALAPEAIPAIGPAVIAGIVSAGGLFQGAAVAENWQRSKYYKKELDREGRP
jgi:hypothetical protein